MKITGRLPSLLLGRASVRCSASTALLPNGSGAALSQSRLDGLASIRGVEAMSSAHQPDAVPQDGELLQLCRGALSVLNRVNKDQPLPGEKRLARLTGQAQRTSHLP